MNDSQNRKHATFTRMRNFGNSHAGDFAPGSLATELFTALDGIVGKLEADGARHTSSRGAVRQGTATRSEARDAVREDLEAINRTARAMSDSVPGLEDKFRIPPVGNDRLLMTAARAAALDAAPIAAQFIAHEMPADFLAILNANIAALEASMSEQTDGLGSALAARASIEETIEEGMVLKGKLNAIVRNKYANNPPVLAEWTGASHIERAPRRRAATTDSRPESPVPANPSPPSP